MPPAPIPAAVTAPTPSAVAGKPRLQLPDFDATATDIPDVSSFDFPVLTDAVEDTGSLTPFARVLAPPPARRLLEPKVAAPSAPPSFPAEETEEDPDLLHQTQTMRALSFAKSIDDVSDSMAETLFGEADLDFLSAALASAVGEGEEAQVSASASSAPSAPSTPSTPSAPTPPVDDLMDLFNLGPDAPLELIDDSTIPPGDRRKAATRRGG